MGLQTGVPPTVIEMWRAAVGVILVLAAATAFAQEPGSQPATRTATSNQERLASLLALIEGQNAPDVRRTGARELLLQRWPETPPRLITLLGGPNAAAKVAVATVLAELPEFLDPAYIDPLINMLADTDPAVRQAAAGALAGYRNNGVTPRLQQLALDSTQTRPARLAAIAALGLMTEREAIGGLVAVLSDPDPTLAQAALSALAQATAMDFGEDAAAARAWWEGSRTLSREVWQQLQIERLVRKDREMRRRLDTMEARLAKALEASFLRAADTERVTLLVGYLADASTTIRLLGLRFAQLHLAEGKSLPTELQDRIRDLLGSTDPREQAAAVQTVASLREPSDSARFLEMLPAARTREVRMALLNGLGYVGAESATGPLVSELEQRDEQCVTEAVAALGRLAERGVLAEDQEDVVVEALLRVFERSQTAQVALRERVLWAMGNVADPRCGPAFVDALDRQEAVVVRQAAVRGIAALNSPQFADALAEATSDPDAGVRKAAIQKLALLGSSGSERQVRALWDRVVSPLETDETIRQAAWRGVLDILSKGSADDIERWIARLSGTSPQDIQRRVELLQRLVTAAQETEPVDRGRLGLIRARLAGQHVRLDQPTEAVAAYVAALADLHAVGSNAIGPVALDLLRCALASGRYDESVAAALAKALPVAERLALWDAAKTEVEMRLTPAGAGQALAMLAALERCPPGGWPEEALTELTRLRERAQQITPPPPETAPASPLESAATTQARR